MPGRKQGVGKKFDMTVTKQYRFWANLWNRSGHSQSWRRLCSPVIIEP
jgi:hypothetical protein